MNGNWGRGGGHKRGGDKDFIYKTQFCPGAILPLTVGDERHGGLSQTRHLGDVTRDASLPLEDRTGGESTTTGKKAHVTLQRLHCKKKTSQNSAFKSVGIVFYLYF